MLTNRISSFVGAALLSMTGCGAPNPTLLLTVAGDPVDRFEVNLTLDGKPANSQEVTGDRKQLAIELPQGARGKVEVSVIGYLGDSCGVSYSEAEGDVRSDEMVPLEIKIKKRDNRICPVEGGEIAGIFGVSPRDVWAAGDAGRIQRWDGQRWLIQPTGISDRFFGAVWASGAGDVWAVGANGLIAQQRGGSWQQHAGSPARHLNAIAGRSPTEIWAVGEQGTIVRYDGRGWAVEPAESEVDLMGVTVTRSGEVLAVGQEGVVLRRDAMTGKFVKVDVQTPYRLRAIFTTSTDDTYAVGANGVMLRYTGQKWSRVRTDHTGELRSVWASGPGNVWAVGDDGTVLLCGGADASNPCRKVKLLSGAVFTAVWGAGNEDVWIGGIFENEALMIHYLP